jgi:hypothetical protein
MTPRYNSALYNRIAGEWLNAANPCLFKKNHWKEKLLICRLNGQIDKAQNKLIVMLQVIYRAISLQRYSR